MIHPLSFQPTAFALRHRLLRDGEMWQLLRPTRQERARHLRGVAPTVQRPRARGDEKEERA